MPIVTVTALAADQRIVERLLTHLAEDIAEAISCPAGGVWCSFVPATVQSIGIRGATAAEQCPIVVIRGRVRRDDQIAAGMTVAARTVARELGVPLEDVWVQWIDVAPGRAYAGGDVIR